MINNKFSGYKGPERRKHKRIKKHFIARFQTEKGDIREEEKSHGWEVVTIQNIGKEGILFNYNKKIALNLLMRLRINFPAAAAPIECVAKVIRVEKIPYSPIFRIAAIFKEISEEEKELVNKVAEEFYLRKPKRIEP